MATDVINAHDTRFLAVSVTTGRIARIGVPLPEAHIRDENLGGADPRARASAETGPSGATDDVLRDWQIMQTRLDREDEAEEMAKLWHDDPPAWLERSKTSWHKRHRSRVYAREKASGIANPSTASRAEKKAAGTKATRKSRPAGEPLVALGERGRAGLGKRACSLVDLLAAGLIKSGAEKVFIVYQENTWIGELTADGAIKFQGRNFASPSAWSIFAKRLSNPTKKADDGWKSVRYGEVDGPTLDQVKGEYARLEQLKEAGIDVEVEEANRRLSTDGDNHRSGQSSPSPRASRKRKASDVVVASSDDMSWIEKYPGCELGVPEPYAGSVADENMDFSSLVGRYVCVLEEGNPSLWWSAKVVKLRDFDTHVVAELLHATSRLEKGVDLEELASAGALVVLDEPQ